ncbi:MAG: substrate-binding domain-containing protein [Hyphomicrobiales bacterium]|nr:substrate-binding domain-containing protein [Hyphomicrobiales bacterium]
MPASEEIVVLSGGAMRRFMTEAVPLFERASGHRVAIRYAPTREMKAEIEAGAAFDVALLPRSAIDALVQSGKVASDTPIDVVRSLVGLMVRTGSAEPDIGTVDKFIGVLRQAKSISHSTGPSGQYVGALLERLGLSAEMKEKTVLAIGRPVGEVIAGGEAEIGMQQIIENQPVAGARLVGPLPAALGNFVAYTAGFAAGVPGRSAVRDFVGFLASSAVAGVIRAKGMEPAST